MAEVCFSRKKYMLEKTLPKHTNALGKIQKIDT